MASDTLNQQHDKIQPFLANNEPRIGSGKSKREVKSNITDNASAKMSTSKGTIQGCNAYIPDNPFRSRDPKFIKQKHKYGKRIYSHRKGRQN